MAELINLEVLDPPLLEQTNFEPDMQRWLSNIVDIINASFQSIDNALNNIFAMGKIDIGGSGAGPIVVSVTGVTSTSAVSVNLISASNANIAVSSVVPGTDQFSVTFSADPGASAIIVYQVYSSQP